MREIGQKFQARYLAASLLEFASLLTRYLIIAAITLSIPKGIPSSSDLGRTLRLSARAFRSALRLPSTRVVQFIGIDRACCYPCPAWLAG